MSRFLFTAVLFACAVPASSQQASWERIPLGKHTWTGFTHAVGIGEDAYFLHGRDIEHRGSDGTWDRWQDVLPHPVGPFSAARRDTKGNIVVVPGNEKPGFVFEPSSRRVTKTYSALALKTERGCQLALDAANVPHVAIGGRGKSWGRVVDNRWEALPDLNTVTPLGMFSAGLFFAGDRFIAFGDHHVNNYFIADKSWPHKGKLFTQLGIRPALDRGGMGCQDPETGTVCLTLGKGSRTLGLVLIQNATYYHLRPRLPFELWDEDRCLYVSGTGKTRRLNLLSRREGALFRIPVSSLYSIGTGDDKRAEAGSPWVVWNTSQNGSHGDLARERDSICNLVFVEPFLYLQRKNIVRRIHYKTIAHSKTQAGYSYGPLFATMGAAFCYDGSERIYICNGYTRDFWALELLRNRKAPDVRTNKLVDIPEVLTRQLHPLPLHTYSSTKQINNDNGGGNTSMTYHDGQIYAVFDPVTRVVRRYSPRKNTWSLETVLPAGMPYDNRSGIDMFSSDGRLWVLSKNKLTSYSKKTGWAPIEILNFEYSSDGGMACLDPDTKMVYVALGGGSRTLATIHLPGREQKVLKNYFPDAVSVHGRRIYIGRLQGKKYLSIFRGHDSAEHWRMELPADGRL
ncbi:MAG: hypothetical protein VX951_04580 [Planctomycetota bacterium]|nr:hypothetical protein [Planctomycetota bacterium]